MRMLARPEIEFDSPEAMEASYGGYLSPSQYRKSCLRSGFLRFVAAPTTIGN